MCTGHPPDRASPSAQGRRPVRWIAAIAVVLAVAWSQSAAGPPRPLPSERALAVAESPFHFPGPSPSGERSRALAPEDHLRLTELLDEHLADTGARLSVSAHDLASGATFDYGGDAGFRTASVAKVNILLLLLLQAQEEDREPTAEERRLAEQMIRFSDNTVTDTLYRRIGFTEGFTEGNERLGLRATSPDPGGSWGATETTAADQLRLWRSLVLEEGPLSADNRSYARELLADVAPEQAWGVSAAAGAEDTVEVKNGWVPRTSDGGRWAVNSTGFVHGPERGLLISVLSEHHSDYAAGVACVEYVSAEVAAAFDRARRAAVPQETTPRFRPGQAVARG